MAGAALHRESEPGSRRSRMTVTFGNRPSPTTIRGAAADGAACDGEFVVQGMPVERFPQPPPIEFSSGDKVAVRLERV
jgi:hypothetical protein